MQERDTHDSDPNAPATPRVSGEVAAGFSASETPVPQSSTRAAQLPEPPPVSEPGDTLLSAGKPADRLELLFEDRLATVDDRLRQLESRLEVLEQKKSIRVEQPRERPWLWIAFLIALVVVFQLLRAMR